MTSKRRILAIGGGGFMMEGSFSPIDREILRLTAASSPTVCVLPTPAGDAKELLQRFYAAFEPHCVPRQLTPFRKTTARSLPLRHTAEALRRCDAVFVTGGNTKSALGVWREWGIDAALREAYQDGLLLTGMSAGAICWFEHGFTDSFGDGYEPLTGLGLLKGGCSAHHSDDTDRTRSLLGSIERGAMPATLAIDDYAAVLFENEQPVTVYSWKPGATARVIERSESGTLREVRLKASYVELGS